MVFVSRQGETGLQVSQLAIDPCRYVPLPAVALKQLAVVPFTCPHDRSIEVHLVVGIGLKDTLYNLILRVVYQLLAGRERVGGRTAGV